MRLVAKKTEDRQRLTVGGRIRPGEKVLTKTAAANATAAKIYEQGIADGIPSDEIAQKITEATKLQNPLRPVNPPWFTVRSADFAMPEIAGWLMEKFGEDRGDGRHIYRFPVVFPVRDPDLVLPHTLAQYNASRELVRYCTEDPKTGAPMCMERAEVEMVNRKARRPPPGGRPFRTREWNGGICDPSSCPEYQADPPQCSLHGELIYAVPEAPGGHYIGTPINSWYSADQILRTLDRIAGIRGDVGIAGAREDGRPLFWLTKRQSVIGRIDRATGKRVGVKQWLVYLEADVQLAALVTQGPPAALLEHDSQELPPPPTEEPPQVQDEQQVKELRAELAQAMKNLSLEGVTWEGLSVALQQAGVEENWARDTEGLACAIGMVELAGKNPKVLEDLKTFSQEKPF